MQSLHFGKNIPTEKLFYFFQKIQLLYWMTLIDKFLLFIEWPLYITKREE